MRTAWDTVFIEDITFLFHGKFDMQGYKSFFKLNISKKGFIDFDGTERYISKKGFGLIRGCFWKKLLKTRRSVLESASDFPPSEESDFSNHDIRIRI